MAAGVIEIISKKKLLALIIKSSFKEKGLKFFVPDKYPQQLGYISRMKGHIITPHIHGPVSRKIRHTQEVLFIRKGALRVDFYDEKKHYVESRIVGAGDVVFLAFGGHGFEFIKNAEIIEVKQGPFFKKIQPVRFESAGLEDLKLKNDTD